MDMNLLQLLETYPKEENRLIDLLLEIQKQKSDHSISQAEIRLIADHIGIAEAKVCSVISFYTLLSFQPRGRYIIQVCRDIPCHVNHSSSVVSTLEQLLGIQIGQTTTNGLFSLEYASCLGHCDAPPSMRIDGRAYVHLTPDKVKAIISEYRGRTH
jgi:NADH-quinone oxidoreductase subunit E